MAIRFDLGEIRSPHRTHDGMLVAEATFARDGILEYRTPDGKRRKEFRPPEENKKALTSFGLAPVTIEHPSELVTEDNAAQYRKGMTLQNVVYGKGGFVRGEIAMFDSEAIAYATSGQKVELSAGYTCDIDPTPGIYNGEYYDAKQVNIRVNHIALTSRGRAGQDVRLHLDSSDDVAFQSTPLTSTQPSRMATLRIDAVDYSDVSEALASAVSSKLEQLKRVDSLTVELEEKTDELEELQSKLDSLNDDLDREKGRADMHEMMLTNAEIVLDELGYTRDAKGDYIKVDGKGKKMMLGEEDESEMDEEGESEDEQYMEEEMPVKGKGKGKKMKADMKKKYDSALTAKELLAAWREADSLVKLDSGEKFSDVHFDSAETIADIHRLVVAQLKPKLNLDSKSEEQIDFLYEVIKVDHVDEPEEVKTDSVGGYSADLGAVMKGARSNVGVSPLEAAYEKQAQSSQNWQQPLSLSK